MNNYSALQRFLHHISLSSRLIREVSFDLECSLNSKKCEITKENSHVFIAGLARSGTTVLLNALYQTGEFASLTYEDMPFILAPNLWQKIKPKTDHSAQFERAHGDGIMVSTNSPEAFEEVFWHTYDDDNEDLASFFKSYVKLILLKNQKCRYLSKNNQNVRRIDTIQRVYPNAHILIPFRDPLQHAYSLFRQHKKFSEEQEHDKFVRQYMCWIGHSEFGLDYRPITEDNLQHTDFETLGRRPIKRIMIQEQKRRRFHVFEFLANGRTVQQNQALASK